MAKAVCFSVAAMDYFPDRGESFAGGNSLNQAIQLKQQGFETAFIGAVGNDSAGDRISELFKKASVDVSRLYRMDGKTASNRIVNDTSGERFGVEGAWNGGVYEEFRLGCTDWNYVEQCDLIVTHANCPDYTALLKRGKTEQFVAVDFLHLEDYELMRESSDVVDVIFSGGHLGMVDELQKVALEIGVLVVLTLGAQGSMAFLKNKVYRQNVLPLEKVIDTTGCGDAFQAAFSCEYYRTRNVESALLKGAHAGREVAGRFGAAEWL